MLTVNFSIRESKITWFIDNNWIILLSFLLTTTIGIAFRMIKNSNKKIKISSPTGGGFIDECIEPDSVYEIVHPALEIVVKQMLGLRPEAGPVIISVPVLILSYIVSQQPIKQITILGVSVFADQIKDLGIKTLLGIACGSIFFFTPVGVVSLSSVLLGGAVVFNIAQGINNIECNDFVSKLPMEQVSKGKTVSFLERPTENNSKVFIKDNENTELYSPRTDDNKSCYSEYKQVKVTDLSLRVVEPESQTQINRKCEKEYVPLKKRTKTLDDLKKQDSTANREEAAPYIKRYEDRRKRIINRRINNNEE